MDEVFAENTQYYDLRKTLNLREIMLKVYNRTETFETLTFLRTRIWEVVPDYIKEFSSLEEIILKIKLWNPENHPCKLCKRLLPHAGSL